MGKEAEADSSKGLSTVTGTGTDHVAVKSCKLYGDDDDDDGGGGGCGGGGDGDDLKHKVINHFKVV